jgi:tellurite resistance protein
MDVELLTNSSLIIGPIFFVFWSLLMILILANVFIAILSDAYNAINTEQKDEKLNISKTLSKTYKDFITSIKQNISIKSTFSEIDKNNDGQVNAIELQKTTGLKQKDAQTVINMFDTDNDGNLNKQEMTELKRALTKESNDNMMRENTNDLNEIVNNIIGNNSQENNSQEYNQEQLIDDIGDVLDELSFISFTEEDEDIGLQCTNSNSTYGNENENL